MIPEERAELRAEHGKSGMCGDENCACESYCADCGDDYPCPTLRLLDALEAAEADMVLMQDGPTTEEWMAMLQDGKAAFRHALGQIAFGSHITLKDAKKIAFDALGPWLSVEEAQQWPE